MAPRLLLPFAYFVIVSYAATSERIALNSQATDVKPETETGLNLIVDVQGKVQIRRSTWHNYASAMLGTTFARGDLLEVTPSSAAQVVCSDLTLHTLSSGIMGVPCAGRQSVLRKGRTLVVLPRLYQSGPLPTVLSPRRTKLLSNEPVLRWMQVEGVRKYTICVRGENLQWCDTVGAVDEFVYPKNAPPLKSGHDYKLIVTAGDLRSDQDSGFGLGFSVLEKKEAVKVTQEGQRIRSLGLSPAATGLLIAHLYDGHELNAEAIEQLQSLVKTSKEPVIARFLGEMYLKTELVRQAEASYEEALDLSAKSNDDEGEILAHRALAEIYSHGIGNAAMSVKHLRAALALADRIGDQQTEQQIQAELSQ